MFGMPMENANLESAMARYRYVRVFLEYLDSAQTLVELNGSLPAVEPARDLVRNGRDVFGDYDDISIAMERVLNTRRSIDSLHEDLGFAVGRFDIDLELAEAKEARDWEALVEAVDAVPHEGHWASEEGFVWFEGRMDEQGDLLTKDEHSLDRIQYYQRSLRSSLFDEDAPSPDALEVCFRLTFGKLVDVVPFAL